MDIARINAALDTAVAELVSHMRQGSWWEGELSSSALSTATAVSALAVAGDDTDRPLVGSGVQWLADHQNSDGGWGDTSDSPSNLATTLLCVAAIRLATSVAGLGEAGRTLDRSAAYTASKGATDPSTTVAAITRAYGNDRTFAVPILVNCALAGMVPWDQIPRLPFELAALPHSFYKLLRLHVVSYALPALIAIGLKLHEKNPPGLLSRATRKLARGPVLAKLARIQPESGGFLEAAPLTSFVAMSLGSAQPVARRCCDFLRAGQRVDGSWPIDTNLSTWVTTSAVVALASAGRLDAIGAASTVGWIAACQARRVHPYTHAAPGGWAWTHLSGGVPDADDTSGALLAVSALGEPELLPAGARWLIDLQNSNGGWPTFCRGWGKLPFDRSSPDLTAHAIRALAATDPRGNAPAIARGFGFLARSQRADGSWIPLWFGNQHTPGQTNPVLGTARVLRAYERCDPRADQANRGLTFLTQSQNPDGGWGGARGVDSTVEETALAVSALAGCSAAKQAVAAGVEYLLARIDAGTWTAPSPIGLYFASLWYSERLYPIIWTVEALGRVAAVSTKSPHRCTEDGELAHKP